MSAVLILAGIVYCVVGCVVVFRIVFQGWARDFAPMTGGEFLTGLFIATCIGLAGCVFGPPLLLLRAANRRGTDWDGIARRIGGEHPNDKRRRLEREAEDRERYIESLERRLELN